MEWTKKIVLAGLAVILAGQLIGCSSKDGGSQSSSSQDPASAEAAADKDPLTGETYPAQINIGIIEGGPESAILLKEDFLSGIGIKVNTVTYSAGTDINNAVVSGDVDVASFGSSPIALGIANGIKYRAVFIPYVQGGNIEALAAKKDLNAGSVADLKGKTIAAPFGTTSHYALLNALKLAGLTSGDVTLLDMGGQDIVAAWTRGDIDAAYIWSPALDECLKDGVILTNDGELAEQGVLIPEIAVAETGFSEKYPTLVSRYVRALMDVYDLVKENPEQAVKDVAEWEGITEESARGQIDDNIWVSGEEQLSEDYLGTDDRKGKLAATLKTIADFHQAQGNISQAPDEKSMEDAIDPSFAEQALKLKAGGTGQE
ncbi:ABC transporter substrate-binding protein [Lachnospiraceae bacterium 54-53]